MTHSVALSLLYALRVQLDAVTMAVEAELGIRQPSQADPGACPMCGAPEDKVEDISTLDGTKRFHCGNCQHYWTPLV